MLDNKMLGLFRERLLTLRQELLGLEQMGNDAAKVVELDQTRMGRLSRMDALQGQAMSQEMQRRRQIELQKISVALQRMEKDEYGYCVRCGEDIAIKRLEFDPATPFCISCANESDG